MFMTRTQQLRARVEALEIWCAAANVVSTRWDRFLHAEQEMREVFAFGRLTVAALDSEEAAAGGRGSVIARPAAA